MNDKERIVKLIQRRADGLLKCLHECKETMPMGKYLRKQAMYSTCLWLLEKINAMPNIDQKPTEDERIRKGLIKGLSAMRDIHHHQTFSDDAISINDALVWLEMQGTDIDINPSEFEMRLNKLLKQFESLPKEDIVSSLSFYLNVIQNDGTYKAEEKQGEQKPTSDTRYEVKAGDSLSVNGKPFDYENANIQQKDFASINDTDEGIVEAVKDTSILDMVEPKFKVGDWIVNNYDGTVGKIARIHDNTGFEKDYHLWTIQDAKDGDVLAEDTCIFIIQKLGDNNTAAKTYCTLYDDGDFDDGSILYFDIDSTKPATKEQRELFFKKMKEAGYEWDNEKKELKIVDWSKHIKYEPNSPSIVEPKQEWSEGDEKMYRMCVDAVEYYHTPEDESVVRDWLKSLKNRVQPQPKEWSEEDEEMTKELIGGFLSSVSPYRLTHTSKEIADWLDSVKCRMKGKED